MSKSISKALIIPFLIIFFVGGIVEDADAQRRKRKKRKQRTEETENQRDDRLSFTDKLTYEIGIGNSNSFSGFNISLRPAVAYKVAKHLNLGFGAKYGFDFINIRFDDDVTLHTLTVFPYAQIKITESIYAKGIYEYGRYPRLFTDLSKDAITEFTPLFGAGYTSGLGNWKWGFELLFVGNEVIRDLTNPLQYWIVASYRL